MMNGISKALDVDFEKTTPDLPKKERVVSTNKTEKVALENKEYLKLHLLFPTYYSPPHKYFNNKE